MSRQSVRILRYDPERDTHPHYSQFTVEVSESTMVLDILDDVKGFQDATLTYRKSCRQGICGSCAMRVNDRARLACKTRVQSIAAPGETFTIEPLANLPVIKDLVVDMARFWEKYRAVMPNMIHDPSRPVPEKEYSISKERTAYLRQFAACIQCGACYSACPILGSDDDYLGPAALAKAYRFANDPRDDARGDRLKIVGNETGVWRCHTIFNCTEVCPKGVEPTYAIQQLKRMTMRKKLGFG